MRHRSVLQCLVSRQRPPRVRRFRCLLSRRFQRHSRPPLNLLLRHRQRRRSQDPPEGRRVQGGRMRTESPSRIFLDGIAWPSAIWMLPAYGRCGRQSISDRSRERFASWKDRTFSFSPAPSTSPAGVPKPLASAAARSSQQSGIVRHRPGPASGTSSSAKSSPGHGSSKRHKRDKACLATISFDFSRAAGPRYALRTRAVHRRTSP